MKYRVAIGASSFAQQDKTPLKTLEEAGVEVVPNPCGRKLTEEETIFHLNGVDGLLAGLEPLNRKVLQSSAKLKAIARIGIGMANVDLETAKELGIKVSNTPDGPTEAVAEMTLACLLTLCRGLLPANSALHRGKWEKRIGAGLRDLKVLIVGFGRIGQRVGKLLKTLGAEILVTDPFLSEDTIERGMRQVNLDEGLKTAQVISLNASGNKAILGPKEFDQMREGTILLNAARGELVDEKALVEALDRGKVTGAWFDVFWEEPYNGPLIKYEQVLLTPHICTYTRQCRLSMEQSAVHNLLRDLDA